MMASGAHRLATSGMISGVGVGERHDDRAIRHGLHHVGGDDAGADRPRKTSAPAMVSASVRNSVFWA